MTLQELCKILGKSESTLKHAFPSTCKNLAKKGIIVTKKGYGKKAEYFIKYKED